MKSYISRQSAIENLHRFFPDETKNDMTVEEIIQAAGREAEEKKRNKSWLSNKLTSMQEYGFFTKHYSTRGGQKKIIKLSLTNEGKRVLGRDQSANTSKFIAKNVSDSVTVTDAVNVEKDITVSSVRRDIELLRQKEPELDIEFNVKLKELAKI